MIHGFLFGIGFVFAIAIAVLIVLIILGAVKQRERRRIEQMTDQMKRTIWESGLRDIAKITGDPYEQVKREYEELARANPEERQRKIKEMTERHFRRNSDGGQPP